MDKTPIADDEILYRRVPNDTTFYKVVDGKIQVSSQAFSDRNFRPSVDRAKLRENDPRHTQRKPSDGIVSVITQDVRAIHGLVQNDKEARSFTVDVEHAPIFNDPVEPDNPAHAEIHTIPMCDKKVFRKLIERLAQLAKARPWEMELPH